MRNARPLEPVPQRPPTIESKVLELVHAGWKVHDIAALLGVHPAAVKQAVESNV